MKLVRRFGPGGAAPSWVDELDRTCFGETWSALEEREVLWVLEPHAAARWALISSSGEAELLRIAVDPNCWHTGLGRELLRACMQALGAEGYRTLHLEVRVSNVAARALYESEGWRCTGVRKGYYKDGEDAAVYAKEITD